MASYFGLSHRLTACFYRSTYKGNGRQFFSDQKHLKQFKVDPWGVGMSYGSDAAHHMCHFHSPLEGESVTADAVRDFRLPKMVPGMEKLLGMYVRHCHSRGLAVMGSMEQTGLHLSWIESPVFRMNRPQYWPVPDMTLLRWVTMWECRIL